jgi:cell division protein FtsA
VVSPIVEEPIAQPVQEVEEPKVEDKINQEVETTKNQIRRSFFDKYVDKIKDFLDNAE